MIKFAKYCESLPKSLGNMRKCVKSWKSLRKCAKFCESMLKAEKVF